MKKMKMAAVATFATLGLAFLLAGCSGNATGTTGNNDDLLSSSSSSGEAVPSSSAIAESSSSSSSSSSLASSSSFLVSGKFTDERDGQEYNYVTIGSQVWMAENLNYNASGSWCYNDNTSNCVTYGRLYDWSTAMDVCPSGWHLPSDVEWDALATAVGGVSTAGKKLKARSENGTDDYGFSALLGGYRHYDGGLFKDVGYGGFWWSATDYNISHAYFRFLDYHLDNLKRNDNLQEYGFSVRCLRGYSSSSSSNSVSYGTLTDSRDGNSYRTVEMPDGKTWMAENLNYNASRSWCYNDNTSNCVTYGRLYDWATAMDIFISYNTLSYGGSDENHQGICPSGWHLPSDDEWDALVTAVGGAGTAGTKLKARSKNGTDDYGFSALLGGTRDYDGSYRNLSYWWSTTEVDVSYYYNYSILRTRALLYSLEYNYANLSRDSLSKAGAFSVRCVRNYSSSSSSVSSNSSGVSYGTLTDSRDGNSYYTVEMPDSKTWMAENLNYNAEGSWCYDGSTSYCDIYGRLYDWATAMAISTYYNTSYYKGSDVNHRGVCPSGWHLPSDGEWSALGDAIDGNGRMLKAGSDWNYYLNSMGFDVYGFSALPGGYRNLDGSFFNVGYDGRWWSATEYSASNAYGRYLSYNSAGLGWNRNYKEDGFSVRCLRD